MKHLGTVLLVGMVTLVAAMPAGARKPSEPPDRDHPPGLTCAETTDADQVFPYETDEFTVTLDPGNSGCVDWTTTFEAGWTITVDPGEAGSVYFNVRDSHPGDFCWIGELSRQDVRNGTTTLVTDIIPIAVADACGTDYTDEADTLVFTIIPGGKPSTVTVTAAKPPAESQ